MTTATTVERIPAISVYRRLKANPADYFSPEEISRSRAYHRPHNRLNLISSVIGILMIVAIIWLKVGPRLIDAVGVSAWPLQLFVVVSALIVISLILRLPVAIYRTFVHEKKWGFTTQKPGVFVSDQIKGLVIALTLLNALFIIMWAIIRATDLWWLLGAVVLMLFSVIIVAIAPIVIIPLFNKLTPIEDDDLRTHLRELAKRGGIEVADVLAMDASKRTRHDNAFFTGLGKTKRVVIFDNMVGWDRNLVDVVIAHEVGHWRHRHLISSILIGTVTSFLVFVGLKFLMEWQAVLEWAGVTGVEDPGVIPLFILAFGLGSAITSLIDSWVSRAHERQADLFALNLIRSPAAFTKVWREFQEKDIADLSPSWWKRMNGSHPPVFERIAFGELWEKSGSPTPSSAGPG
jgi:STE24 endopeptidase